MSNTGTTDMLEEGADLVARAVRLGLDTLRDLQASPDLPSLADRVTSMGKSLRCGSPAPVPRGSSCGCDIPPPCWYPRAAGDVTSYGCPGSTAVLRLRIHNCGATGRRVRLQTAGEATFEPQDLGLAPMEREVSTVSANVPKTAGAEQELLLWVRGCHDHYVRWRIVAADRGSSVCCHELDVEDCPDYLHHWYDHFYCAHPCTARRSASA